MTLTPPSKKLIRSTQQRTRESVTPELLKYFSQHDGQLVYVEDAAKDLNLTDDQVRKGVQRIWSRDIADASACLEIVQAGRIWRWRTAVAAGTGILYEQIAVTKTGTILAQDEDGNIYKMTPVE